MQFTAQQLGSSLGTAFLGAVVITGLIAAFSSNVEANPKISDAVNQQVKTHLAAGASFVASSQVEDSAKKAGVDQATTHELVSNYEDAQLESLKLALLFAALLVVVSFPATAQPAHRAASRSWKPKARRARRRPSRTQRQPPSASSSRRLRAVCQRRPSQRLQT